METKHYNIGEEVWDDLTDSKAKVVKVLVDKNGNIGYWIDNEHLRGARLAWELSEVSDNEKV